MKQPPSGAITMSLYSPTLRKAQSPSFFTTSGKGRATVQEFRKFLEKHGGDANNIIKVVCDISKALLAAAEETFPLSSATVDWFHVAQLFTKTIEENHILTPVAKALETLDEHKQRILRRRRSSYTNARLEELNSLFQAARSKGRGYRNTDNFITMIYLIATPLGKVVKST